MKDVEARLNIAPAPDPGRGAAALAGAGLVIPACLGAMVAGVTQTLHPFFPVTGAISLAVTLTLSIRARKLAAHNLATAAMVAGFSSAAVIGGLTILALDGGIDLPRSDLGPPSLGSAFQNGEVGVIVVLSLLALGGAGATTARRLVLNARHLRLAGRVAPAFAALLVALACARSARRPDPDDAAYFNAIPTIATLPSISGDPSIDDAPGATMPLRVPGSRAHRDHTEQLQDAVLMRSCRATSVGNDVYACTFRVIKGSLAFELTPFTEPAYRGPFSTPWPGAAPEGEPMFVRYEPRHDIWLIESGGRALVAGNAANGRKLVRVRELAYRLAPPRGWILAAGLSLVLAIVALFRARGADLRRRALSTGLAGTVTGDGRIVLDAGGTVPAPRDLLFLPERVIVFARRGEPIVVTKIVFGDREALLDSAEAESLAHASTALVGALLGALPLVIAAGAGMLF